MIAGCMVRRFAVLVGNGGVGVLCISVVVLMMLLEIIFSDSVGCKSNVSNFV